MTDDEINMAIAEACGWYDFGTMAPEQGNFKPHIIGRSQGRIEWRLIPDYCNGLNAMHEAENGLTPEQRYVYGDELAALCIGDEFTDEGFISNGWGYFAVAHATTAQRAEAFLRTVGKWKD